MRQKKILFILLLFILSLLFASCGEKRPLQFHAVRLTDDNGTGPDATLTPAQIQNLVNEVNDVYDFANYKFLFDPQKDVGNFRSTLLNTVPAKDNLEAWQAYRIMANGLALWFTPDKAVVYFRTRDTDGFSWGPEGADSTAYVSMSSYSGDQKGIPYGGGLLAHELGHYLGLIHTHTAPPCDVVNPACNPCAGLTPENTDGDFKGMYKYTVDDDVKDTNGDPGPNCAKTTTVNCPESPIMINGITFDPPWINIMTYHVCHPFILSLDQVNVINRTLEDPIRAPIRR